MACCARNVSIGCDSAGGSGAGTAPASRGSENGSSSSPKPSSIGTSVADGIGTAFLAIAMRPMAGLAGSGIDTFVESSIESLLMAPNAASVSTSTSPSTFMTPMRVWSSSSPSPNPPIAWCAVAGCDSS